MSRPTVRVENLAKRYRIGAETPGYATLRGSLASVASAPLRWLRGERSAPVRFIWALQDVSFEVAPGEVLGIIGQNGAGKSTLLKILSQVTEPTTGEVNLYGRVGSLLEVGTGFHAELTGRENIYLNGAILGMRRAEIRRKFDAVVAFAEVEKFIDTPVKHYSSGMYMRLAFAVAAHLEPEILIVDEVLAVGDGAFQEKCIGKMQEVATQGRTVLFVSHNLLAVRALCSRALLLSAGRITATGKTPEVVEQYLSTQARAVNSLDRWWATPEEAPGNDGIRIARIRVMPDCIESNGNLYIDNELAVEVDYWNLKPGVQLVLNAALYTSEGVAVFESFTTNRQYWHARSCPRGRFRGTFVIPRDVLNDQRYRFRFVLVDTNAAVVFDYPDALVFTLRDRTDRDIPFFGRWPGVVRPALRWEIEYVGDDVDPGSESH